MDFRFTPEQEAFREEIAPWVQENLPPGWHDVVDFESPEGATLAREWRRRLAAKGWLTLAWPREYGGSGADIMTQVVFHETLASLGATVTDAGVVQVGPTLMAHGTEAQKEHWLKGIAEARWTWAQGYAEPGAGSDLASLQTCAVEEEDDFIINGSKLLSSAHAGADMMFLLARTNPDAPRHRGISLFLVALSTPGIQAAKAPMMGGGNRTLVLFDNVRVPRANLVGEKDQGWYVGATLLDFERSGIGSAADAQHTLDQLIQFGKEAIGPDGRPAISNPTLRHRFAQLAIEVNVARMLAYGVAWRQSQGPMPSKEASIARSFTAELHQRIALAGMQTMGLHKDVTVDSTSAPLRGRLANRYWRSFAGTVGGGSAEIQRTIIATRGLGLPRG